MGAEVIGVIILGGAHGVLAVARSLGRKNIPVVLVTDDHPLPGFSRYVRRSFAWPGPLSPSAAEWLIDFAGQHDLRNWLLIPGTDAEVKFVAENLCLFGTVFKTASSDWRTLKRVCDKQLLANTAAAAGLAFPKNYQVRSADEAAHLKAQFPVVLKPAMRTERNAFTTSKAWRADSQGELAELYQRAASLVGVDEVVVQELIPGGGEAQFSYAALWRSNKPVAELVARRTRQYPIEFSRSSTFVEVVRNESIKYAGRQLLHSIGFDGIVEVEFKFDRRDGTYKVLDVNPRPWAWFALCEAAGLDLAVLMLEGATPEEMEPVELHGGLAWIDPSKDVAAAVHLMFRGELTVGAYLRSLRQRLVFAAFAWDDRLPAILELPIIAYRSVRRALASLAQLSWARPRAEGSR